MKGLETRAMMKRRCHWGLEERRPRGDLIPGCREKTDGYWKPRRSVAGPAPRAGGINPRGRTIHLPCSLTLLRDAGEKEGP